MIQFLSALKKERGIQYMDIDAIISIAVNILIVFGIKVFDNIIGTSKTLLIQKNKSILASITVIVSQIIFYKLINVVSNDGEYMIYIVALASGLGTYLALKI